MTLPILSSTTQAIAFLRRHVTGTLHADSRQIRPCDGFIAWPGARTDGRAYVIQAATQGASACLIEAQGLEGFDFQAEHKGVHIAALPELKTAAGHLAAEWFERPGAHLQVLAVTGTNGKTSTAWWLAQALNELSKATLPHFGGCAFMGTLGVGVLGNLANNALTTPEPISVQRALHTFAGQGLGHVALEASSIGLAEHRLAGTPIQVALWTNLTQDHLDWHGSMQSYWQAKRALFDWPGLRAAVINVDDPYGAMLWGQLQHKNLDIWTVSINGRARLAAQDVAQTEQGLSFTVVQEGETHRLHTCLAGAYNVANLLGVIAALCSLGVPLEQAVWACTRLSPVPGRMERVAQPGCPLVVVDYAHTPDALRQVLSALRPIAHQRGGQLWCIFGCGGNRDAGKRPHMGAAATQGADRVVVTSDNPRDETPETIIEHVLLGTGGASLHVCVEPDRAVAIARILAQADAADVVLIAGKGHERWQEIAGQRLSFSDMEHARTALAMRTTCRVVCERTRA